MWSRLEHTSYDIPCHNTSACEGQVCCLHNCTAHHMRSWPQHYRWDTGVMERICKHGVGHPDPDQFKFWQDNNMAYKMVHGCDGCCLDNGAWL